MPVSNWPELLPEVQLAMNNKRYASTKHSPAELMFGNKLRRGEMAVTVEDQIAPPSCLLSDSQHESKINKDMKISEAQTNLTKAAEKMKQAYDSSTKDQEMKVGDQVLVKKNTVGKGELKKLNTLFHQPSEISRINMPLIQIKNLQTGRTQ